MHGKIVYPKVTILDVLKAFWRGMEPQKWKLLLIIFGVVATNILYIITPLFYKQFFDTIFTGGETSSIVQILLRII